MPLSTCQTAPGVMVLTSIQTNASNAVTDPDLKADVNGNTLTEVESVTYLGVTFSDNAKWTAHAEYHLFPICAYVYLFLQRFR